MLFQRVDLVGIAPSGPPALGLALGQNSPNPFHASTRFDFTLPRHDDVTVSVYDLSGRLVATLLQGALGAGPHVATWDGTSAKGSRASAGIYQCVLRASTGRVSRRLVLTN